MSTLNSKMSGLVLSFILTFPFIFAENFAPNDPYSFVYSRFQQILESTKTDVFNWEKKQVVLIGPSDIAINVSSREVNSAIGAEAKLLEIRNYSVIQGGPNVLLNVLESLLSQVKEAKKIDLVIFRFQPMMYTKEYTAFNSLNRAKFGQYTDLRSAVSDEPFTIFPQLTSRLYSLALQGGKAEGSFYSFFGEFYRKLYSQKNANEAILDDYRNTYSKIWTDYGRYTENFLFHSVDYPDFFDILKIVDEKYNEKFFDSNQKKIYFGGYESHAKHFNFLHYNFDPKRLEDLRSIIKLCNQISKKTIILLVDDILENEYGKPQRAAYDRLSKLRNAEFAGQKIIEYRPQVEQDIKKKDYFDLVHYRPDGIRKFSNYLAGIISKELEIKK